MSYPAAMTRLNGTNPSDRVLEKNHEITCGMRGMSVFNTKGKRSRRQELCGMPVTSQSFAVMLKQLRTAHGMTQEELAERSGASVRSISDLERGISRFPRKDTVQLLADALQLSPDESAQLFALARAPKSLPVSRRVRWRVAARGARTRVGRDRSASQGSAGSIPQPDRSGRSGEDASGSGVR